MKPVDAARPTTAPSAAPLPAAPVSAGRIDAVLRQAALRLAPHSDSPRLDAELLLGGVLGVTRTTLILHGGDEVPDAPLAAFDTLVARRAAGSPLAYLTGRREFWSLDLEVTPDVLVPRPDTELLVELALARLPVGAAHTVLDLGTGSGAIALAIAAERPGSAVTGSDLSAAALAVAARNAARLGLPQLRWRRGSWFDAVPGERFDLIVANPPYIAAGDSALATLEAEPLLALSPGSTGLEAFAAITASAARHLRPDGWLLLEHGSTQAAALAALLTGRGFAAITTYPDLAGRPRVTAARAPAPPDALSIDSILSPLTP